MSPFVWPLLIVAIAAWVSLGVFMVRMAGHGGRLPECPWYVRWNPVNIILRPDLWDEAASQDGRRAALSLALFIVAALLAWIVSIVDAAVR